MFCPKCGKEVADGQAFCGNCGVAVGEKKAASATGGAGASAAGSGSSAGAAVTGTPNVTDAAAVKKGGSKRLDIVVATVAVLAILVVGFATGWFGLAGCSDTNGGSASAGSSLEEESNAASSAGSEEGPNSSVEVYSLTSMSTL